MRVIVLLLCCLMAPVWVSAEPDTQRLKEQIAELKLELRAAKREILQQKADRINAEREVLSAQIEDWNQAGRVLQRELSELLSCDYDLAAKQCRPEEKKE